MFFELFHAILFGHLGVQWNLSRPLLSVYLTYEKSLEDYFTYLQTQCDPEQHARLMLVYREMSQPSYRSLDAIARDTFSMDIPKWRRILLNTAFHHSYLCL